LIVTLKQYEGQDEGDWVVWAALNEGDPTQQPESFVIGCANNPTGACEAAVRALNKALDDVVILAHDHGVTVER
jgi:hypothetical protein